MTTAPTVSQAAKKQFAAALLKKRKRKTAANKQPAITKQPRQGGLPLTIAQKRFWYFMQLNPGSPVCNVHTAVRLDGVLDDSRFATAVDALVERHEPLRTTFELNMGEPVQMVDSAETVPFYYEDLSGRELAEQKQIARATMRTESLTAFDLTTGPLSRFVLLRFAPDDHLFIITLHHINGDGQSLQIMFRDLLALYDGQPLQPHPFQYADYASWQATMIADNKFSKQLDYWMAQLGDAPTLLNLPTDRPRPTVQRFEGNTVIKKLSPELVQGLQALSQEQNTTLYMTLLAAYGVLLSRYANQTDLVVGTSVVKRQHKGLADLVGVFTSTLGLRMQLDPNLAFVEALRHVRQMTLDSLNNRDVPFETILDSLKLERNLSYSPLFQVMFDLQYLPDSAETNTPLRPVPLDLADDSQPSQSAQMAKFDLVLIFQMDDEGLTGSWEYNVDLFDRTTIERMAAQMTTLLNGIVAQPSQAIQAQPLLTEEVQNTILNTWNHAGAFPSALNTAGIHTLVEAQAASHPTKIAVTSFQERLTYQALNEQANQLARHLRANGVVSGSRVGILLHKSLATMVSVLAVLKAGGTYIPIDPEYPAERVAYLLADSQAAVVITTTALADAVGGVSTTVICLDLEQASIVQMPSYNLALDIENNQIAYMVYTSGSTGRPKGVMVQHGSLIHIYNAWADAYELDETTAHLQMASFSFDVFAGDWVRALCSGKKLVLCTRQQLLDSAELYALMQQEQVDCAEFVPVVLKTLVTYLGETQQKLGFMRVLIAGSDSWSMNEYRTVLAVCGSKTRLINSYGLTEATIDSTYFEGDESHLPADMVVPIGRPFSNTQLYILDGLLQPVPVGVVGELYVGGSSLALGYWQRPRLTAEKFIPHLYQPYARLYHTGDLARYLPDGTVEFLGRADNQVKLHGIRIELGEIETALSEHAAIHKTAVTVHKPKTGAPRLVAYVVVEEVPTDIKPFLKTRLPAHMVPHQFIVVDGIPVTPNGKVNRRALPDPDSAESLYTQTHEPPSTPTQQTIAAIWVDVLGLEGSISIHDNFFGLGGQSLLATQIITRINETLSVEIGLRTIFEQPTIADLADEVVTQQLTGLETDDLSDLLAELADLSDEDVAALMQA